MGRPKFRRVDGAYYFSRMGRQFAKTGPTFRRSDITLAHRRPLSGVWGPRIMRKGPDSATILNKSRISRPGRPHHFSPTLTRPAPARAAAPPQARCCSRRPPARQPPSGSTPLRISRVRSSQPARIAAAPWLICCGVGTAGGFCRLRRTARVPPRVACSCPAAGRLNHIKVPAQHPPITFQTWLRHRPAAPPGQSRLGRCWTVRGRLPGRRMVWRWCRGLGRTCPSRGRGKGRSS